MASTTTSAGSSRLGAGMAIALVVGNMIGSGVFLLPSVLAAYGDVSILAWVFTSAGAVLLALVFARLGRAYPETGWTLRVQPPRVRRRHWVPDRLGYWIAIWAGNAAIAVAFVSYSAEFWPALEDNAMLAGVAGVAAIWVLTWINVQGVRQGGVMQAVTTVLKLVPLVAIATLGLLFIDAANFAWNVSGESNLQALTAVAALTLWGRVVTYEATRLWLGSSVSAVAGVVSGLLGVGGGFLKVPAMHLGMRVPVRCARAEPGWRHLRGHEGDRQWHSTKQTTSSPTGRAVQRRHPCAGGRALPCHRR